MVRTKLMPTAIQYVLQVFEDDQTKIQELLDKIWAQKKDDIALKGFRKGHVPREHAESVVGFTNLYEEVLHAVLADAVRTSDQKIVGIGQVEVHTFEKGKPIILQAEAWVRPDATITADSQYKGLVVQIDPVVVEETEIDAVIQTQRDQGAVTQKVERPAQMGDAVVIDFEGRLEEGGKPLAGKVEKHTVVLGAGTLFAGFEEKLVGLSASPEVQKVELVFPEEFSAKNLAGKKAIYDIVVREVQQRDLPEINDEFATRLGATNVAELREKIRQNITTQKGAQNERLVEDQLLNKLQMQIPVSPVPECMIDNEAHRLMEGLFARLGGMSKEDYLKRTKQSEEELLNQHRGPAATNVRVRTILEDVAAREKLEVTEAELEEQLQPYYERFAKEGTKEEIKARAPVEQIKANVLLKKSMQIVREQAVLTAKEPVVAKS